MDLFSDPKFSVIGGSTTFRDGLDCGARNRDGSSAISLAVPAFDAAFTKSLISSVPSVSRQTVGG